MDWLFDVLTGVIYVWIKTLRGERDTTQPWGAAVPNLHGLPEGVARKTLSDNDLCIELVRLAEHPATAEEVVVDQSPAPGQRASRRSTVTVYMSGSRATHGPHARDLQGQQQSLTRSGRLYTRLTRTGRLYTSRNDRPGRASHRITDLPSWCPA